MYPISHAGDSFDVNEEERVRMQQLFEDNNVTLFGCGHDHMYSRLVVNGVTNIVAGGAGAPLYGSPWGGDEYHYVRADVSYNSVNFTAIKLDGEILEEYQLPYTGPIEIGNRVLANTSTRQNGTMPEIYFSEVPKTKYFSWDSGPNSTTLTGLPDPPGDHTLDVYAENDAGVWSHARFVFTTTNDDWSPTPTDQPLDITLVLGLVGVAAVAIIVVIFFLKKRSSN
jgi:hypothetical protein